MTPGPGYLSSARGHSHLSIPFPIFAVALDTMARIPDFLMRAQWRVVLLRVVLIAAIAKLALNISVKLTLGIIIESLTVVHHLGA